MRITARALIFTLFLCNAVLAAQDIRVCFEGGKCIQAEIADRDESRRKGLMFCEKLPQDAGMLFVFEGEARPSFWLKNVKFPLDIIWIDENKTVVGINTECLPCQENCASIVSEFPVRYVLEVNAGFVDENKIKVGDKVIF